MTTPTVSVVVPCYNGGRYLDVLCASLAAQTFRDFEIVIVDDGSTDDETRHKLAQLEGRARIIRQENRGLAAARNAGFRAASADFVLPLDCDDTIEPAFLAETVPVLRAAPPNVVFVFTHMRLTGAIEGVLPRHFNRFDQLFLNRLPYCLLMRKSAWQAVGGYDENMRDGYEDWEFNIRLTLAGYQGVEIAKPLFVYFVSSQGMLMSRSARMHGTLWRRIRQRHAEIYRFAALQRLSRLWREESRNIGLVTAMAILWSSSLLPPAVVSLIFYTALKWFHWLRVKRGALVAPGKTKRSGNTPHF